MQCLVIVKAAHTIEDKLRPVVERLHPETWEKLKDSDRWELDCEVALSLKS